MTDKQIDALKLAREALEYISSHYMSLPKIGCMALAAIEEALAEQETVLPGGGHVPAVPVAVYGYCPECGGAGVMRERRPNGDDKCTNGHKYPSSKALAEQPAQQQEPEPDRVKFERHWRKTRGDKKANRELPRHPLQPQTYIQDSANRHWVTWQAAVRSVAPPASKPWVGLSTIELDEIDAPIRERGHATIAEIYRAIESKLREKNA